MNILFLSIVRFGHVKDRGIYTDLIRKFKSEGHNICVVFPTERRYNENTELIVEINLSILKVKTLNIQKTNLIEKGISTIALEMQFLYNVKKYFKKVKFDLVLYSTPPITFSRVIKFIKQKDGAKSYLLLKDIFPQNAVDLGFLKKNSFLHKWFKNKESELYAASDFIGCMSPANVDFLLKHNPLIDPKKIGINPNSIEPSLHKLGLNDILDVRTKYSIPNHLTTFIYGGNLGKPQGLHFLVEVLISNKDNNAFFVIIGDGTEFSIIQTAIKKYRLKSVLLLKSLPKNSFDELLLACDVGLIFLNKSFTIPNYPSRLLSYMEVQIPIISATDLNTDIGKIMEKHKYGFWSESGDLISFNKNLNKLINDTPLRKEMGINGYNYLLKEYHVNRSYDIIIKSINNV